MKNLIKNSCKKRVLNFLLDILEYRVYIYCIEKYREFFFDNQTRYSRIGNENGGKYAKS